MGPVDSLVVDHSQHGRGLRSGFELNRSFPPPVLSALLLLTFPIQDSLKHAASFMAQDMMSFYSGDKPGGIPGLLPQPYYCQ